MTFGLKIGFSNEEELLLKFGPQRFGKKVDAHISVTSFSHTLDPYPTVNSLGSKFCSQPIKLVNFRSFYGLGP